MPRRLHHPPYPTLQELYENKGETPLIDLDVDQPWRTTVEGVEVAGLYKDAIYLVDGSIVPYWIDPIEA